jgi:hypothetical protein
MIDSTKTCCKCKVDFPATVEFFYRNTGGKFGITPRCKTCVNEDNKESYKKRFEKDPEKIRVLNNKKATRHYHRNIEEIRQKQREWHATIRKDPERRKIINMKKRGGGAKMTPQDFEDLFNKQNRKCAICYSEDSGSRLGHDGWNIDHCHKTKQVRFILCCHCNRGLGAFRDNPVWLRKAADMLEKFYDFESESPVGNGADTGDGS